MIVPLLQQPWKLFVIDFVPGAGEPGLTPAYLLTEPEANAAEALLADGAPVLMFRYYDINDVSDRGVAAGAPATQYHPLAHIRGVRVEPVSDEAALATLRKSIGRAAPAVAAPPPKPNGASVALSSVLPGATMLPMPASAVETVPGKGARK